MDTKTVQLCASRASTYIVAMPNKRTKLHMYKESLDLLTAHLSRTSESGLVTDLTPAQQTALYHAFCRVAAHISSPRHLSYIMATFDFSPHELGEEGILPQDPEPNAQASTSRSPPHHPRPDLEPPPAKKSKPTHPLAPDEMPAQYLSKTYNDHMTDYLNAPTALNLSKLNKRILTLERTKHKLLPTDDGSYVVTLPDWRTKQAPYKSRIRLRLEVIYTRTHEIQAQHGFAAVDYQYGIGTLPLYHDYSTPFKAGDPVHDSLRVLSVDAKMLELQRLVPTRLPTGGQKPLPEDQRLLARVQQTSFKGVIATPGSVRALCNEFKSRGWNLLADIVQPYDPEPILQEPDLQRAFTLEDVANAFHQIGRLALADLDPPRTYEDLRSAASRDPADPDSRWLVELAYRLIANLLPGQDPPHGVPVLIGAEAPDILDTLLTTPVVHPSDNLRRVSALLPPVSGLTSTWIYAGCHGSVAEMHTEDNHLGSANIAVAGSGVKVWFLWAPEDKDKIIAAIRDHTCHQGVPSDDQVPTETQPARPKRSRPSKKAASPAPTSTTQYPRHLSRLDGNLDSVSYPGFDANGQNPNPLVECQKLERHRQVRFDPRVIEHLSGCAPKVVFQVPGRLLVVHPDAFHAVVNIGDILNLATNLVMPDVSLEFPYACGCGAQAEVAREWDERDPKFDQTMLDAATTVFTQWNKDVNGIAPENFNTTF